MTMNSMRWPDHWRVLFGFEPDQQEADSLVAWLSGQFPPHGVDSGWTETELITALNAYAENIRTKRERSNAKNLDGRIQAPTGPQIKSQIIKARYESRHSADPTPAENEPCGLCGDSGWTTHWIGCGDNVPFDFIERCRLLSETVPCVCSKGDYVVGRDRAYRKLTGDKLLVFNEMRWEAARQARKLIAAYEKDEEK